MSCTLDANKSKNLGEKGSFVEPYNLPKLFEGAPRFLFSVPLPLPSPSRMTGSWGDSCSGSCWVLGEGFSLLPSPSFPTPSINIILLKILHCQAAKVESAMVEVGASRFSASSGGGGSKGAPQHYPKTAGNSEFLGKTPGQKAQKWIPASSTRRDDNSAANNSANEKERHGLPWWSSGWESACQCRGHGFEPWSGKIPHVTEQLGPWATVTEPARLEPVLRNKRDRDNERPVHCDEEWPPLATTRESPRTETKTQHSHK